MQIIFHITIAKYMSHVIAPPIQNLVQRRQNLLCSTKYSHTKYSTKYSHTKCSIKYSHTKYNTKYSTKYSTKYMQNTLYRL